MQSPEQKGFAPHHRPAAGGNGGTDELSHSLGQPRVFLGMNMAATAIPQPGADERDVLPANGQGVEDVVLYFGIIDILQVMPTDQHVSGCM